MPAPASNPQPVLRPQDVVVLLRLFLADEQPPSYANLAAELSLTASETHASVQRLLAAQLVYKGPHGKPQVVREGLRLFLQHGVRYAFAAKRGELTRGMPTGYAAPPLQQLLTQGGEPPPVWPSKDGTVRGMTLYPLYPTVPQAAQRNPALYELLVLVDALRGGSPRERALAINLLDEKLKA